MFEMFMYLHPFLGNTFVGCFNWRYASTARYT